jgi:hypothetical protein
VWGKPCQLTAGARSTPADGWWPSGH